MRVGVVVGTVVATRKDSALTGLKLLLVRPLSLAGLTGSNEAFVAADSGLGAGVGDQVLVTEYSAARVAAGLVTVPVDAVIVGIVDSIEIAETAGIGQLR